MKNTAKERKIYMIENIVISDQLIQAKDKSSEFDHKFGAYDHLASGELTVTISLAEYRSLLTASSKAKVDEANSKRWEAESQVKELQKELETVKKQLAELRTMFAGAALETINNQKEAMSNG